jgi:MFS superfamily sulfate permease-like transporter
MVCGLVGAVPLTGVIIRSATNVAAGAQTRLSSILHGFWLLAIVALFPGLLRSVPTASLAAVLVVAVFKLINLKALQEIWQHDRREIIIYTATAATIIFWGVLPGVLLGIGLAIAKLLYTVGRLRIRCETDPVHRRAVLHLEGTATFISLPKLAAALEQVPPGTELHIHIEDLGLIDHACLDLLMQWERQHRNTGGSLTLDWERLRARFTSRVAAGRAERVCPPRTSQTGVPAVQQRRSFLRAGWQKLHDSRT